MLIRYHLFAFSLYYDYCNNGNINAVDTEWENEEYPCYSCNGEGETEDEEYNDDTEESFLFNVKESNPNNQRKTLQIDLANEGVENNTSNDIVWRIFAIENECYLALTYHQLNRLKLDLYPGIQYVGLGEEYNKIRTPRNKRNDNNPIRMVHA